jgi:hypothetical protein
MFWAIWGWSPYITMQRSQNAPLVGVPWIDHIVYRNGQPHTVLQDIEGWALRQVYAVPLFAAAAIVENNAALILWFFPFAVGVVGAYVVAWRLWYPGRWGIDPTGLSECLTGAIWGTSILAVSHGL